MKFKFWTKEPIKEPIKEQEKAKKIETIITIFLDKKYFKREYFSWENSKINSHSQKYLPWKRFIKWYHSRPQSKSFSFYFNGGLTVIERRCITGYNIVSRDSRIIIIEKE